MFQVIIEDYNGVENVLFEGTYEECQEFMAEERINLDYWGDTTSTLYIS